ncbi:MAG: 50S ribosomal protein L28 [Firmicutes bacterium]|nr:50S ribosomal protein L28 [Bacillota bacterium]
MARQCAICAKKTTTGNNVSHSNRKTRRAWKANLQRVRILRGNTPERVLVCTRCLKSGKVVRAI